MKKYFVVVATISVILLGLWIAKISHMESPVYAIKDDQIQPMRADAEITPHEREVSAIHEAGNHIRIGNSYVQSGQIEMAVHAYEQAYLKDAGSRGVSGFKLAGVYQRQSRYDEAIQILDEMISDGVLSDNGIKNANALKEHLESSKQ
jgi:pentatricopeptide repeat protein